MQQNVSRKMSLVIGARRHLEWGHEKYIMDTIQSHPAQVMIYLMNWICMTIVYLSPWMISYENCICCHLGTCLDF